MSKTTRRTDALITEADFAVLKEEIVGEGFKRLVFEMCAREPHLAFGVSDYFQRVTRLLAKSALTAEHQAVITKHLALLTWSPFLVLERAHRRAWDDFLPLTADEPREITGDAAQSGIEGGAA